MGNLIFNYGSESPLLLSRCHVKLAAARKLCEDLIGQHWWKEYAGATYGWYEAIAMYLIPLRSAEYARRTLKFNPKDPRPRATQECQA